VSKKYFDPRHDREWRRNFRYLLESTVLALEESFFELGIPKEVMR
jgi:hypothetical protein